MAALRTKLVPVASVTQTRRDAIELMIKNGHTPVWCGSSVECSRCGTSGTVDEETFSIVSVRGIDGKCGT